MPLAKGRRASTRAEMRGPSTSLTLHWEGKGGDAAPTARYLIEALQVARTGERTNALALEYVHDGRINIT
jgi:hypothetical protein